MDMPTSPSTPLGPMTRARAKAIEDKVNSLLSELPLPTHETWLLPHSETLCLIRYMEVSQGSTTCKNQDGEDPKHVEEEEEMLVKLQALDVRPSPDVRRLPGHGRPTPSGRPAAGHPNRPTDDRNHRTSDRCTPEPNLRTTDDFQTSGPSRSSGQPTPSGRPTRPRQS